MWIIVIRNPMHTDLSMDNGTCDDFSVEVAELNEKYLMADGLMLSAHNRKVLNSLLLKIDREFELLFSRTSLWPDSVNLPGTNVTKGTLKQSKREFDDRVEEWFCSADKIAEELSVNGNSCKTGKNERLMKSRSKSSKNSVFTSTSSSLSLKRKEGQVKLKLALYAKELEEVKQVEEIEAQQEIAKAKAAAREALEKSEAAARKAEAVAREARRKSEQREKERNLKLAMAEKKAWDEVSQKTSSSSTTYATTTTDELESEFEAHILQTTTQKFTTKPLLLRNDKKNKNKQSRLEPAAITMNNCFPTPYSKADKSNFDLPFWPGCRPNFASYPSQNVNPPVPVVTINSPAEKREPLRNSDARREPMPRDERPVNNNFNLQPPARYFGLPTPKFEIDKFDGDPLKYNTFIRSFDNHIAPKLSHDDMRLLYLLQYCTSQISQTLEHLVNETDGNGYQKARYSLFERFGQPHIVACSCEQKILDNPRIKAKDFEGLQSFSLLLEKSLIMMKEMGDFSSLSSFSTIKKILDKLPEKVQEEWVKWAFIIQKQCGRHAKFPDLVEFIREQTSLANSLYGKLHVTPVVQQKQMPYTKKSASFGTFSKASPKQSSSCLMCKKQNHSLSSCKEFKELSRYKRLEVLKRNRLCFKCLKPDHVANDCTLDKECGIDGCRSKRHHELIHKFIDLSKSDKSDDAQPTKSMCAAVSNVKSPTSSNTYLMTVPVRVSHGTKEVYTNALLDSGSQKSFCELSLAEALNVEGPVSRIPVQTLSSGVQGKVIEGMVVSLSVSSLCKDETIELSEVLTVEKIPIEAAESMSEETLRKFDHLHDLSFPELKDKTVGLLIGIDTPAALRPLDCRFGEDGGPEAVRTPLGWVLYGPAESSSLKGNDVSCFNIALCDVNDNFPSPHEFVLKGELTNDNSREDRVAHEILKNAEIVKGHFQVPLLWRNSNAKLPNNRMMAQTRLQSLKRRLDHNNELKQKYVSVMQSYVDHGWAEKVEDEEPVSSFCWYLPHHPVVNPRKPEKLRIVFDCAAKFMGISLNNMLMSGPDFFNRLDGVLTRFRADTFAVVSDIESMFHQVRVDPKDRDALRFLWWKDGDTTKPPDVFRMTVHLFGASSSPSVASFCLKEVAKRFGDEFSSNTVQLIARNFYVDDFLASVSSVAEGTAVTTETREILAKAGFNLTKWLSNNKEILNSVPVDQQAKCVQSPILNQSVTERILGVAWDVGNDEFYVRINCQEKPFTRRGVLSVAHSLFDPLGFVAPTLIMPKVLLRELCDKEWDEPLTSDQQTKWEIWLNSLSYLEKVKIPRCFKMPESCEASYELHHFCDASLVAYGSVAYLRSVNKSGNFHVAFLMGKGHLSPKPSTTVPRLELLAAVTAVRLDRLLRRELPFLINQSMFWTDSAAVLQSIYNNRKRFPVFVANRLAEIERCSQVKNWRHVPSKLNPADEISRGVSPEKFSKFNIWLSGPPFLTESSENWPQQFDGEKNMSSDDIFLMEKVSAFSVSIANSPEIEPTQRFVEYFSSLYLLKRATAWLLRFIKALPSKVSKASLGIAKGMVTVEELRHAELQLVKYVQNQQFGDVISKLSEKKSLSKKVCSVAMLKLNPILCEGVVRVGGRLSSAPVDFSLRHPVILPKESHFTDLVVRQYHESSGHPGYNGTLSSLREMYWIERGSSAVKKITMAVGTSRGNVSGQKRSCTLGDLANQRRSYQTPHCKTVLDCSMQRSHRRRYSSLAE